MLHALSRSNNHDTPFPKTPIYIFVYEQLLTIFRQSVQRRLVNSNSNQKMHTVIVGVDLLIIVSQVHENKAAVGVQTEDGFECFVVCQVPGKEQPDLTHRFPVFAQDVETYVSLQVDVRMVNFCCAQHLHRGQGIKHGHRSIHHRARIRSRKRALHAYMNKFFQLNGVHPFIRQRASGTRLPPSQQTTHALAPYPDIV